MAKDDIVQHNIRLNLNNPYDLKLHQAIMNANMDIYKSKNNYLRKVVYRGIFGDADGIEDETEIVDFNQFVSKKELEEVERRVRDSILREMFGWVFSSVPMNRPSFAVDAPTEPEEGSEVDDAVAEAAIGYF